MTESKNEFTTVKFWVRTMRNLRTLHALTGESLVALMDRVVTEALEAEIDRRSKGGTLSAREVIMSLADTR